MKTYKPDVLQFQKIDGAKRISFRCDDSVTPQQNEVIRVVFEFDPGKTVRMIGEVLCVDNCGMQAVVFVRLFETDFPVTIS